MKNRFYLFLLQLRPAFLGVFFKRVLGIQRQEVSTFDGFRFSVDPVSHFGSEMMRTRTYEAELSDLFQYMLRPGDTFVDVGGNEGYFSIIASRMVGKGKVVCIEPQARLIPVIQKNIALNRIQNIAVVESAVGDAAGEVEFYLSADTNTGSSGMTHRGVGSQVEKVKTQTLDQIFSDRKISKVRLVKLDCEGAEEKIIHGMIQSLKAKVIDFMVIEYHPQIVGDQSIYDTDRAIRAAGYQLTQIENGQWVYHLPGLAHHLEAMGPLKQVPPLAA